MDHVDLLRTITRLVRDAGPAAALDALRRSRPDLAASSPVGGSGYHDTLAMFHVWAVDRLVAAGLSDTAILWHPLTDVRSPLSWWDAETLVSIEARTHAVASTLAEAWEPAPVVRTEALAA